MANTAQHNLVLKKYDGKLNLIKDLAQMIDREYSELFHSVIVHGSVATNEVIPYSDFDGLLVVKDSFLTSEKLNRFKSESMKLILKFDPLQHHGWFQIKESQWQDYPQHYLPYEVLENSKLVFPSTNAVEVVLTVNTNEVNYKKSLSQLLKSIENQSNRNFKSERLYEVKSFLSKVMLLPTMYYSAKYNDGIFKKDSFVVVKINFNTEEWNCIHIASLIGSRWNYSLTPIQKLIVTRPERLFRRLTKKYISPRISDDIVIELNEEFFKSLKLFIKKINKDILAN